MSSSCKANTTSRPIMTNTNNTTNEHITAHRTNPSCDTINWTYPTQYRPRGPNQSVPSAAHKPSSSISSTISSLHSHQRSRSDVSIIGGTQETNNKLPERIDSRRALLSMANGIKAPLLLRGPSHSSSGRAGNGRRGRTQIPADVPVPSVPKRTSTVQYLHKELPPTPPSSSSSTSAHSPGRRAVLPTSTIKPLNLSISAANTLAAKRLSRSRGKLSTGGSLALSRFRAVPAPIQPPSFRGPTAFNGPSSASTTDDEFAGDADIEELHLGEPLIAPQQQQAQATIEQKVMTPMGDLPITPLDIPVDWDDLHDRWTSPTAIHPETESSAVSAQDFVLDAFHQDVNALFARSPTIEVRGSIEAGFSPEREYAKRRVNPFSSAPELSEADSEGSVKKEKRHGKVLVKKELKLCLDMNVDFGETKKRRQSNSKIPGPKAGESFLMISPLSPESAASLRHSILC